MMISRFNRLFEKHGRVAFILMGIVVVVPFVIWVSPGGQSGAGMAGRRGDIGTMYGKKLSREAFIDQYRAADLTIFLRWGQFPSETPQLAGFLIDDTLRRIRALREAKLRGLDTVGDQELARTVREHWLFQTDGRFDAEKFTMFQRNLLSRRGIDGPTFDRIMRDNIAISRLEESVVADVYVSAEEVRGEFLRSNEEFAVSRAEFIYFDLMNDPALDPDDEQVNAYFTAHRAELRQPDNKRVRFAEFKPEQFAERAKVSDEEVRKYFDDNKERLYTPQNKTFDAVKAEIEDRLRRSAQRREAWNAAQDAARRLAEPPAADAPALAPAERLAAVAKELGGETRDSGVFNRDSETIPEIGAFPALRDRVVALSAAAPFSAAIQDHGSHFVAAHIETIPGAPVDALTDSVKKDVRAKIHAERARAFYAEHVETYRERLSDGKTPDDLRKDYAEQVTDKTDDEKAALVKTFDADIAEYLTPYFVPDQKRVRVAVFRPDAYRAQASVSDERIKDYYERNSALFQREEVRVRQILVRVPRGADDAAKAARRGQIEAMHKELLAGADFAQLASTRSEDFATRAKGGDLGFIAAENKNPPIEAAALKLEPGQISDIIESPAGFHLLKAEEKRQGRTLEDATADIRATLLDETIAMLVQNACVDFAARAFQVVQDAPETTPAATTFAAVAAEAKLAVEDSDWFRATGAIRPFGVEAELAREAFRLSAANPVSEAVKGTRDWYVACWLETKPAYLPAFEAEPGLPERVQRHMKRLAAVRLARDRARAAYESIGKSLAAGDALDKAAGTVKFDELPAFTRSKPPSGIADARQIVDRVVSASAGTLLEPLDTDMGAVLVFLRSRTLPAEDTLEAERETVRERLLQQKHGERLRAFYAQLEKDSATDLAEGFKRGL